MRLLRHAFALVFIVRAYYLAHEGVSDYVALGELEYSDTVYIVQNTRGDGKSAFRADSRRNVYGSK